MNSNRVVLISFATDQRQIDVAVRAGVPIGEVLEKLSPVLRLPSGGSSLIKTYLCRGGEHQFIRQNYGAEMPSSNAPKIQIDQTLEKIEAVDGDLIFIEAV